MALDKAELDRILATCPLGCGAARHDGRRCDGTAINWAARRKKALAWSTAQQAEHDKAERARREGRHYTARKIDYNYQEEPS